MYTIYTDNICVYIHIYLYVEQAAALAKDEDVCSVCLDLLQVTHVNESWHTYDRVTAHV